MDEVDRPAPLRIVIDVRRWRVDVIVAALVLTVAAFVVVMRPPGQSIVPVLIVLAMVAVRWWPRQVLVAQAVLLVLGAGSSTLAGIVSVLMLLVTLGFVAYRYGWGITAAGWAVTFAATLAVPLYRRGPAPPAELVLSVIMLTGLTAAPVAMGRYLGGVRRAATVAQERSAEAEQRIAVEIRAAQM